MARILLGVSGGVAAYKALEFVRLATAAGHSLRVVQTPSSRRFVGSASFAALSGAPVLVSEFDEDSARGTFPGETPPAHTPLHHLELARDAELYVIAPASANTIAKLAAGMADNLLCSCALAADCPLLLAPAMNNRMYEHPATQANLQTLRARGALVLEPGSGRLASPGEHGIGRLAEPAELLAACQRTLDAPRAAQQRAPDVQDSGGLRGLRVLVTAGGTREPLDSVRFLGNSSSGRMGLALAAAALARGAQVTLIAANLALEPPSGVRCLAVRTAAELKLACEQQFPECDVLLMAAAVADFRPARPAAGKIKKSGKASLALELEATPDVLGALARGRRADQTLVGFAAEHGARALAHGRRKLSSKHLDAVVVNDISRTDIGFDSEANEVTILTAPRITAGRSSGGRAGRAAGSRARAGDNGAAGAGEQHVPRASKGEIADAILDAVERLRADGAN